MQKINPTTIFYLNIIKILKQHTEGYSLYNFSFFIRKGAVGCVRDVAHPVTLARKVMEETPHCLVVGEGAMKFAEKIKFPILENPKELINYDSVCKSFISGSGMSR